MPPKPPRGKTVELTIQHRQLLEFLVKYRRINKVTNAKHTVEELIEAYAAQLTNTITDPNWRGQLIALLTQAQTATYTRENKID